MYRGPVGFRAAPPYSDQTTAEINGSTRQGEGHEQLDTLPTERRKPSGDGAWDPSRRHHVWHSGPTVPGGFSGLLSVRVQLARN